MPKITGKKGASDRLKGAAGKELVEQVGRALFVGGDVIRAQAKRLITEGSVSGKSHVPSLPGEPPNADTHHLDTNIEVEQPAPLRVLVTSNAEYAVPLEVGSSKMAARPYMGPAARAKKDEVVKLVRRAVSVSVGKGR